MLDLSVTLEGCQETAMENTVMVIELHCTHLSIEEIGTSAFLGSLAM